ncbi:uncharacterized protein LOC119941873 isoform X1 [Tachyglossus aculeatus]|uniref:uncharacterized protein LOC119941873 isoform X1 n=1 Tax=Tachyglossus aculeatus TaxID=9261 RepID=UPI0018F61B28|nr:uncharacterized protein LOC119941873 isoform X1 [Tachyglossus aculeatus]
MKFLPRALPVPHLASLFSSSGDGGKTDQERPSPNLLLPLSSWSRLAWGVNPGHPAAGVLSVPGHLLHQRQGSCSRTPCSGTPRSNTPCSGAAFGFSPVFGKEDFPWGNSSLDHCPGGILVSGSRRSGGGTQHPFPCPGQKEGGFPVAYWHQECSQAGTGGKRSGDSSGFLHWKWARPETSCTPRLGQGPLDPQKTFGTTLPLVTPLPLCNIP